MKIGPLLLLVALMVVPPLLSALARWLRQQIAEANRGGELDEWPRDPGRDHEGAETPRRPPLPPALAPAVVTAAPARPSVPVPAPRRAMPEGLGSPRDLRHSIVLAAVLGPCRALDPH